jgi:hypothetical protein
MSDQVGIVSRIAQPHASEGGSAVRLAFGIELRGKLPKNTASPALLRTFS